MNDLVMRADRKMFMGVVNNTTTTYTRMRGFSSLTESKNPVEYSRKYVDEYSETVDVTGITSSYDFTFDLLSPNDVLADIADVIDSEKLGDETVRSFISVDFNKPASGGGYEAVKRDYAIIGSSVGDGTDGLVYSGTLRSKGTRTEGTATIATPEGGDKETVETITFTAKETE